MDQDWESILERTIRVRAAIARGARSNMRPMTPLSQQEVFEAELQFGVTLPEEYRQFLLHVDAGGLGPVTIRRLSRGDAGWAWEDDPDTDLPGLAVPFPDQNAFENLYAEFYESAPPVSDVTARDAWFGREAELLRAQTSGVIYLGAEGHGFSMLLVVSGTERGNIWFDRRPTSDTLVPLYRSDGKSATFADLYLDWLEAAESLLTSGPDDLHSHDIRSPIYETRFDF